MERILTLFSALLLTTCTNGGDAPFLLLAAGDLADVGAGDLADVGAGEVNPNIYDFHPYEKSSYVPVNTALTFHFSRPIDVTTIHVNTTDTVCNGAVRLSRDDFNTCVRFKTPNFTGETEVRSLVMEPAQELAENTSYRILINTEMADSNGDHLLSGIQTNFKTEPLTSESVAMKCPLRITREEYLANIQGFSIGCTATPRSTNRIIKSIIAAPVFVQRSGGTGIEVLTFYDSQEFLDLTFNNDTVKTKNFSFSGPLFSPSLREQSIWSGFPYLNIRTLITYDDGSTTSSMATVLLQRTHPDPEDLLYHLYVNLTVPQFIPNAGELPITEWRAWTVVKYADGTKQESVKTNLSAAGEVHPDLFQVYRSTVFASEQVGIVLDTNGDDVPDYTWNVPSFDVFHGKSVTVNATGIRQGGQNIPETPTIP